MLLKKSLKTPFEIVVRIMCRCIMPKEVKIGNQFFFNHCKCCSKGHHFCQSHNGGELLYYKIVSVQIAQMWHNQGWEWVRCREYWFWVTGSKKVTNTCVLPCFWTSKTCLYLCNQMSYWDGVWIIMLNIADIWLIPLDCVLLPGIFLPIT